MENVFEILERLKTEIDTILEFEQAEKNQKELLAKLLNFVHQTINLITLFDQDKIEDWKKNDKYSFLHFVPFLKNFLLILNNYIKNIEPSLKHFYTDEIAVEIEILNKDIQQAQAELNPDFEQISIKEKEKLEREYNNLQILLSEKAELVKKNNVLKKFNIDEIKEEIRELTKSTKNLKAKIEPLKKEKSELQVSLENFNNINNDIENLKNSQEQSSALLMEKINSSLKFIKNKHLHWQQNKEGYVNRLEDELNKLTGTENKIKEYLTVLASYRDSVIKNKRIIEKHFTTNKNIVNSLPELKNTINIRIKKIEEDLYNLDSEIGRLLQINQKISDEITRNPITFDYL